MQRFHRDSSPVTGEEIKAFCTAAVGYGLYGGRRNARAYAEVATRISERFDDESYKPVALAPASPDEALMIAETAPGDAGQARTAALQMAAQRFFYRSIEPAIAD